ncbi:MAG: FAD-dependent oxidoreductase, partial [Acidimicrobiia bacterium]|nr:FAD-dependent oxidoreductase [Acidimicrobiia bacterium]
MAAITVLGAGPTGLWTAWKLAAADHDVTVLERAPVVGGMAASVEVAGQRVDLGSHRLHPVTPPTLLEQLRVLLGHDLQVRRRHGRIRVQGRWVAFPLRAGDLVRRLPVGLSVRAGLDVVSAPLRRADRASFAGTVRQGLGPTVAAAVYEPYATKLWDHAATELDPELARRRVSTRTTAQALGRVIRRREAPGRTFLYPRLGYGQIVERIADAAVEAGVQIHLERSVDTVEAGGRVLADDGEHIDADLVISTLPVTALTSMARSAPPGAAAAASQLRYRAMVLVYLACAVPAYTE